MKIQKKLLLCISILFILPYIFSQTTEENVDTINLPDLSTTIAGEDVFVDEDAVPDFTLILPESEPDFLLSVEFPEVEISEPTITDDDNLDNTLFRDIGLQGIFGGGYPGYFLGEFSVFQKTGNYPFEIKFLHETQNGFGDNTASEKFSKTVTSLYGYQRLSFAEKYTFDIRAWYNTGATDLQGKSPLFHNISYQFRGINTQFSIVLPLSWKIYFYADGKIMEQNPDFIGTPLAGIKTDSDFYMAKLWFLLDWNPPFMTLFFDGLYSYSYLDTQKKFLSHRLNFSANTIVPVNEMFSFTGHLGVVYTKDLPIPVLIPFSIFADFIHPSINLSISGGMKTEQSNIDDLQKRYPFVHFQDGIFEESEWFALIDSSLQFLENFTFNGRLNFEYTAFNQGKLLPNYTNKNITTGIYNSSLQNLLIFDSDFSILGEFGMFNFLLGWNALWLDVIPGEHAQEVYFTGSIVSETNLWGVQIGISEVFSNNYIPSISASAFYTITSFLQVELQLEDAIKLFTNKGRTYAGDFVTNIGSVALFVKLSF